MNMLVLKKSRKTPKPGDVFVFKLKQKPGDYWFGKIVRTDASVGGFQNTILIYIYNICSGSKVELPELNPDILLLPPIATNRLPWSRGYFEYVAHQPIDVKDLLPKHVFYSYSRKKLFDDNCREVKLAVPPIGEYGLHSFRTIDDAISKALGIPLSEDDD